MTDANSVRTGQLLTGAYVVLAGVGVIFFAARMDPGSIESVALQGVKMVVFALSMGIITLVARILLRLAVSEVSS